MNYSLYVHIPFCLSKCHYCDFYSLGLKQKAIPEQAYVDRLCAEMEQWTSWLNDPRSFSTVFFGGGTPSLFSPKSIARILDQSLALGSWNQDREVTLEVNPKTLNFEKARQLKKIGVNRVSMGVQSLEDSLLNSLGRAHSARDALDTLKSLQAAEFSGLSLDLMYGLSGQTQKHLQLSLEKLRDFSLSHLSAYELIIEEQTPFYEWHHQGRLPLPPSDMVLAMRSQIEEFAAVHGMQAYEISNYAAPGKECRHNQHYWDYESFLGLGAGAVSFLRKEDLSEVGQKHWGLWGRDDSYGLRLANARDLKSYLAKQAQEYRVEVEMISFQTAMMEFMMMGLRKREGIGYADFEDRFNKSMPSEFRSQIENFKKRGLLEADEAGCRLTDEGILLSNEVMQGFILN